MSAKRFPSSGYFVGRYWLSRRPHSRHWYRTWLDPEARQTRRASLGTDDLEQAKAELASWHTLNAVLNNERPADVLLRDLVLRHIEHHAPAKRSENQIRRSLLALDDRFPGRTVADLTPGMLEDWGKELVARSPTNSTETVRRVLTDVRAMLNTARKRGELATMPFVPVESFPKGTRKRRPITVEEAAKLLIACEKGWLERFIWIAAATGARTEAILDLDHDRVDREVGLIDFRIPNKPEGKKRRAVVPIARQLYPMLKRRDEALVIGGAIKRFGIAWRETRERAGLPDDVFPTGFRHALHSLMANEGVPREELDTWFARLAYDPTSEHYIHREARNGQYLSRARAAVEKWLQAIECAIARLREQPGDLSGTETKRALRASRVPTPARKLVPPERIELSTSPLPRMSVSPADPYHSP